MRQESIRYFTEKEEGLITVLTGIGIRKNVAKLLVYLAERPETSSREIERGTDLRQPEVSMAIREIGERGWITEREDSSLHKGRPRKLYTLTLTLGDVIEYISNEKDEDLKKQLALLRKMKEYL